MQLTQRTLYVVDTESGVQIDPATLTFSQGVLETAVTASGDTYEGANLRLYVPADFIYVSDLNIMLCPGDTIYLDNQSRDKWTIHKGWYEVDGNPAIYGWYLESIPVGRVRSFYLKDLNNLTMAEPSICPVGPVDPEPEPSPEPSPEEPLNITGVTVMHDDEGNTVLVPEGSGIISITNARWLLFLDDGFIPYYLKSDGAILKLPSHIAEEFNESANHAVQVIVGNYVSDCFDLK